MGVMYSRHGGNFLSVTSRHCLHSVIGAINNVLNEWSCETSISRTIITQNCRCCSALIFFKRCSTGLLRALTIAAVNHLDYMYLYLTRIVCIVVEVNELRHWASWCIVIKMPPRCKFCTRA